MSKRSEHINAWVTQGGLKEFQTPSLGDKLKVWWNNFRNRKTAKGYSALQRAMQEDHSFAYSWHSNIVVALLDNAKGKIDPEEAHHLATVLMKHLFSVDTKLI